MNGLEDGKMGRDDPRKSTEYGVGTSDETKTKQSEYVHMQRTVLFVQYKSPSSRRVVIQTSGHNVCLCDLYYGDPTGYAATP